MLHVHTRLLGLDIEFCLQRTVRDFSQRSGARIKQILQECALGSLAMLLIAVMTITTLVGVVTTLARNHAQLPESAYQHINPEASAHHTANPEIWAQLALDTDSDGWGIQADSYLGR